MTTLDSLLDSYRAHTTTERDKGTAFEKLIAAWLVIDPVQSKRFEKAIRSRFDKMQEQLQARKDQEGEEDAPEETPSE